MKKILLIIAFLTFIVSNAQETSSFEKDTYKLVKLISEPAFTPLVDQFSTMVKSENVDKFKEEVMATFPELYTSMTKVYMEEYNHEEIKGLLKFYETDLGKKMAKNSTKMAQKGMFVGQNWGIKVQGMIGKYK